ncbi:MAG: SIMPL domain-containing protein [Patescibacteria group bacterium]
MPIMSTVKRTPPVAPETKPSCGSDCKGGSCGCGAKCHCGTFGKKLIFTLFGLLLVYCIFFLGTLISNNMKKGQYIGMADKTERMITVSGYGKSTAQNDIAVTTIGYSNTDKNVAVAQAKNKEVMDKVTADLTKLGIEDKDLQTNYSIYPEYDYTQDRGQELKGYKVTHSVTVKIRDLSKINDVLGLAGTYGANEVSGLSFTIDDETTLKDIARQRAIDDAKAKAGYLAQSLGVKIVSVVSYNEYESSNNVYYSKYLNMAEGGGLSADSASPSTVSGGTQDMVMNVSVTYEITQ